MHSAGRRVPVMGHACELRASRAARWQPCAVVLLGGRRCSFARRVTVLGATCCAADSELTQVGGKGKARLAGAQQQHRPRGLFRNGHASNAQSPPPKSADWEGLPKRTSAVERHASLIICRFSFRCFHNINIEGLMMLMAQMEALLDAWRGCCSYGFKYSQRGGLPEAWTGLLDLCDSFVSYESERH